MIQSGITKLNFIWFSAPIPSQMHIQNTYPLLGHKISHH